MSGWPDRRRLGAGRAFGLVPVATTRGPCPQRGRGCRASGPGAPFCIGVWLLWPINLLIGWLGAVVVWFATLHGVACLTGLRKCHRLVMMGSAIVAVAGWGAGVYLALHLWR
jgi:hypothetical protein